MPNTTQEFLAESSEKASQQLLEAYLQLPEEKRNWKPAETSRPALDMIVEIALLNEYTAKVIEARAWDFEAVAAYPKEKEAALSWPWEKIEEQVKSSTAHAAAAMRATPDEALGKEMDTSFGKMTLKDLMTYPYWNMSYHLGQVNYIAGLLGK